jgi:hypothetical protein
VNKYNIKNNIEWTHLLKSILYEYDYESNPRGMLVKEKIAGTYTSSSLERTKTMETK